VQPQKSNDAASPAGNGGKSLVPSSSLSPPDGSSHT
jgi:hypothetical protein